MEKTISIGDQVTWGQKWDSKTKAYIPRHRGKVLSFEGRGIAVVEEARENKKGQKLASKICRPYLSRLTKT